MNQSKLEVISACSGRQAREHVCQRVTITSSFSSDWMRKVARVFLQPIVCRNNAKPKRLRPLSNTQGKTALRYQDLKRTPQIGDFC